MQVIHEHTVLDPITQLNEKDKQAHLLPNEQLIPTHKYFPN